MTTLADYEAQVEDLLKDPTFAIWPQASIDRFIDAARVRVAKDTGCLRTIQTFYLSVAKDTYTFGSITGAVVSQGGSGYSSAPAVGITGGGGSGAAATATLDGNGAVNAIVFSNYGSGYTSAPTLTLTGGGGSGAAALATVLIDIAHDVMGVSLFWGAQRFVLGWMPFQRFNALTRPWQTGSYQRLPIRWTTYGNRQLMVAYPPDQPYTCEADTVYTPVSLLTSPTEVLPPVVQDAVPFYAAHLAKYNQQAYGEAAMLAQKYKDLVRDNESAALGFRYPDPYLTQ